MDAARGRQELGQLLERLPAMLGPVFETTPMMAGWLYTRRIRCGKPTCHCASGVLHEYLSIARAGTPKLGPRPVRPDDDVDQLRALTERYKAVRTARRSFIAWSRRVLKLIDALEAARTHPLRPSAAKRGVTMV